MANINRLLDDIRNEYGRKVERAFADAVADVRSDVVLRRLIDAIERGDIEAAIRVLNIDEAVFASMRQQIVSGYSAAGAAVIGAVRFDPPGATTGVVRWDVTNPTAERFVRDVVGEHITNVTRQTVDGVRERMLTGYAQGQGPRQIALDVVGRIGPNGRRSGGVVGLNAPQVKYVANMREYLQTGNYSAVLRMSKRDKRFDRTLQKAMREGKPLTKAQIEKLTSRYSDLLLKLRGETIARTEIPIAVAQARMDAYSIGMDKKGYPRQYGNKEWLHGGGGMNPRDQHVAISRTVVQGLDTPFQMADGTLMQYSHDPNAPIHQNANCTCTTQISIDYLRMRRDGII